MSQVGGTLSTGAVFKLPPKTATTFDPQTACSTVSMRVPTTKKIGETQKSPLFRHTSFPGSEGTKFALKVHQVSTRLHLSLCLKARLISDAAIPEELTPESWPSWKTSIRNHDILIYNLYCVNIIHDIISAHIK